MSVDLTELHIAGDAIMPVDFGGLLQGPLGGAADRLERQGDRYGAEIVTPAMHIEPWGRRWAARLLRARKEGGIVTVYQPDFAIGSPGSPTVASNTTAGRTVPLEGMAPNYVIREGQWFNYIVDGQRYLDQVREQAIADASGDVTITLQNLIRVPLTAGDVVDFATPRLEGWLDGDFSIPRSLDRTTAFSFTITEKG